jgi:hypothetical protein
VDRLLPAVEPQEALHLGVGLVVGPTLVARVAGDLAGHDVGEQLDRDRVGQVHGERGQLRVGGLEVVALLDRDHPADALGVLQLLGAVGPQEPGRLVVADAGGDALVELLPGALDPVHQAEGVEVEHLELAEGGVGAGEVVHGHSLAARAERGCVRGEPRYGRPDHG